MTAAIMAPFWFFLLFVAGTEDPTVEPGKSMIDQLAKATIYFNLDLVDSRTVRAIVMSNV